MDKRESVNLQFLKNLKLISCSFKGNEILTAEGTRKLLAKEKMDSFFGHMSKNSEFY